MNARFLRVLFSLLLLSLCILALPALAQDRDEGEFIPTGVQITPKAAPGSLFESLNPGLPFDPSFTVGQAVTTALSPDGMPTAGRCSGFRAPRDTRRWC
jgi:hypothetical protein